MIGMRINGSSTRNRAFTVSECGRAGSASADELRHAAL